ncbi:MAG: SagB/ThcOx family dehydrogenase [Isosphaeraceae bacterium]
MIGGGYDERLGSLSQAYHHASRNPLSISKITPRYFETYHDPRIQQMVAEAARHIEGPPRVPLPAALGLASMPLADAITTRSSRRDFPDGALGLLEFGTLLHLGNGVREVRGGCVPISYQRNVPSCGNLGSTEVYPIVMSVEGIEPGIYHYDSVRHDLAQLRKGQFRGWMREFALPQVEFSDAAAAIVLTSAIGRLEAKYGRRSYRLALMDVGHVSENLQLTATAMRLSVCAANGFVDEELNHALGLDGLSDATMLVILIGPGSSSE